MAPWNKHTLFFLHTPKTAGSTLEAVIGHQYGYRGIRRVDFRRYNDSCRDLRNLPVEEKMQTRVVLGHFLFSENLHGDYPRPYTYISVLRDPVERVISNYYYIRKRPNSRFHETVASGATSLEEFVRSGAEPYNFNAQTRFLAGAGENVPSSEVTAATLELAKENVEKHFTAIAITERFDESLMLLRHKLGWSWPFHLGAQKVNADKPNRGAIPASAIEAIEEANQLDRELYRWSVARLDDHIASRGEAFTRELARFRQLCGSETARKFCILRDKVLHRAGTLLE